MYICYEGLDDVIYSKKEWYEWFKRFGDKENFSDIDSWWDEMLSTQIILKL